MYDFLPKLPDNYRWRIKGRWLYLDKKRPEGWVIISYVKISGMKEPTNDVYSERATRIWQTFKDG